VFKVDEDTIKKAICNYQPSNSRSQLVEKNSNKIILDAYNANPSSMKSAIDNFAKTNATAKVLVLGAMAELGNSSLQEHQTLIDEINKHQWAQVLLVGGDFGELKHPYLQFNSATEAGQWLQQHSFKNTYFLIKGSRSMQMEKIVDFL
jgi:UDP-N-acetylmuramoyl-tripeptide--D-alanyl-D-alanine ligase